MKHLPYGTAFNFYKGYCPLKGRTILPGCKWIIVESASEGLTPEPTLEFHLTLEQSYSKSSFTC